MKHSNTIDTINRFNDLLSSNKNFDKEDKFFIEHIELKLANGILYDFGKTSAKKVALILLGTTNE